MMVFVNETQKIGSISNDQYSEFLKLLSPFASHMAEELWSGLGNKKSISLEVWPKYEEKYLVEDEITLVVQVNGKKES